MTTAARELTDAALECGIDFFTGVPCSYLLSVFSEIEQRKLRYWPATREDGACGIAAGAYLAGGHPLVLMQNSGFGNSINALCSLILTYKIPIILIVSWRGEPDVDAVEHDEMGLAFPHLLEALRLSHVPIRDFGPTRAIREAWRLSQASSSPIIISTRKGDF